MSEVQAQFTTYTWSGTAFAASASQAKRFTIGRVYYNAVHNGEYGSMRIKLATKGFKSAYTEYMIMSSPGNDDNIPEVTCLTAKGLISPYARIELGTATYEGTTYSGANNYYKDIYLDVDYYSSWFAEASVSGAHYALDKTALTGTEFAYMTLFSSPSSQDISSFYTQPKALQLPVEYGGMLIPANTSIMQSEATGKVLMLKRGIQNTSASGSTAFGYPYLKVGGAEWKLSNVQTIGFGYAPDGSYQPAEIGLITKSVGGYTYGDIVIANRPNYNNEQPVEVARITYDGKMGIGTTTPPEKLSVVGNIRADGNLIARKLLITQAPWSDYVFEPNYRLRPLAEVEAYINKYKHLPDVPSAKEVTEKGSDIADTQALLLKKIEEMTLYMIEMKKEIRELRKKINSTSQK